MGENLREKEVLVRENVKIKGVLGTTVCRKTYIEEKKERKKERKTDTKKKERKKKERKKEREKERKIKRKN